MNQQTLMQDKKTVTSVPSYFQISTLKSAIQKSVRRDEYDVQTLLLTKSALETEPHETFRRLPVIVLEDCMLHPDFDFLIDMIKKSGSSDFQLTESDAEKTLSIMYDATRSDYRDDFLPVNDRAQRATPWQQRKDDLTEKQLSLVKSLAYRGSIGGLDFDIELLNKMANCYAERFAAHDMTTDHIAEYLPDPVDIDYHEIGRATIPDIPPEAVDFHCSPVVKLLSRKDYVNDLIDKLYPNRDNDDILQSVIWRCRAGVNHKEQIGIGEPVDWFECRYGHKPCGDDHKEKHQQIYDEIKQECHSIADWFLNKQTQ